MLAQSIFLNVCDMIYIFDLIYYKFVCTQKKTINKSSDCIHFCLEKILNEEK